MLYSAQRQYAKPSSSCRQYQNQYRSYAPATIAQKCATAEVAKKAMMSEAKLICAHARDGRVWERVQAC